MGEEIFLPNCKPTKESGSGRIVLECNPKIIKDGKTFGSERPVKIIIEGDRKLIQDDGGAPDFVLERLTKHLGKNV